MSEDAAVCPSHLIFSHTRLASSFDACSAVGVTGVCLDQGQLEGVRECVCVCLRCGVMAPATVLKAAGYPVSELQVRLALDKV